jgi:hypothetical protein
MKALVSGLWILLCMSLSAQVSDHFTDGDFTNDPHWTGDSLLFEVNSIHQLHLQAVGPDTAVLATSVSGLPKEEWRFWMKLSFNPSANNYARVYLSADDAALKGPLNGYFFQAGGISDSISLFRQEGLSTLKLFTCPGFSAAHSLNIFRFRITRSPEGGWEIYADSTGGEDLILQGTFTDHLPLHGGWTGFFCRYTSSNSTKFYFDEFYCGRIEQDTLPPRVSELVTESEHKLRVTFTETLAKSVAEAPEHYLARKAGIHPSTATRDPADGKCVFLFFTDPFMTESCDSLEIHGISDPAGNKLGDTALLFCNHQEKAFDVLISEIMADPEPSQGLPGSEYLELYNRSAFPIRIGKWTLECGYTSKVFPDLILPSHGYLIISSDTTFCRFGPTTALFTSSAVLANEGMKLILRNAKGRVIHSVQYSGEWYSGAFKEEGGWSLEMIDPDNPCACSDNWKASQDPAGGTPGKVNSVYGENPDTVPPQLWRGMILSQGIVQAEFSEPLDSSEAEIAGNWMLTDDNQKPDSVTACDPEYSSVLLYFQEEIVPGVFYTLACDSSISDCVGNRMTVQGELPLAIPEKPVPGDLVINEILPEPGPGGARFVELYNRSAKPVDVDDLLLACSNDTATSDPGIPEPVSEHHFMIMPGGYVALCGNMKEVQTAYGTSHPEVFIEVTSLPAFGPELGQVSLYRKSDGTVLDRIAFDHSMHHPLLVTTAGVSLERVSPERASRDRSNWHSAASSAGYGTPGEQNSQWFEPFPDDGKVSLQPRIFSPDNDGKDDLLNIVFRFDGPGYVANISVFDDRGRKIRQLENSVLSAPEGILSWDGLNEHHDRVDAGIYIIVIELFQPDGKVVRYKKTTVVACHL